MLVKYTIYTQSMADATSMAKRQALASGYKTTYLTGIKKLGNGVWEIAMQLSIV